MAEQLTFDLPARPALGRDDFFVSPANRTAVSWIETWADWPGGKLLLTGPRGAGKTHLVQVWSGLCGARVIEAADLARLDINAAVQPSPRIAVENIDRIVGDEGCEQALFHLHNLALADGGRVLMTSARKALRFALPDLQSRVSASPAVQLEAPDDALLSAVLVKLFADRQINVPASVIAYLAARMERSFDRASALVEEIDAAALARKRPITRALAAEVLDKLSRGGA